MSRAHTGSGLYGIAPAAPTIQGDEFPRAADDAFVGTKMHGTVTHRTCCLETGQTPGTVESEFVVSG